MVPSAQLLDQYIMNNSLQAVAPTATRAAASHAIYPDLAGKCVVITGGGSGIGAGMVEAFARQGARVYFIDIADACSRALEQRLRDAPHPPTYIYCNLMDLDSLSAAFARIEQLAGPVHVLLNNAANDDRHQLADVTPRYWDERMAVNLRHQLFCSAAVAEGMKRSGGGAILNFGSISWHLALPDMTLYLTAKAAIEGMTRGLARDLGGFGIRVNCIIPGAVRTQRQDEMWQTPERAEKILAAQCLKQQVEIEDVAALALFLASDNAARCTGRDYYVDAGWYGA